MSMYKWEECNTFFDEDVGAQIDVAGLCGCPGTEPSKLCLLCDQDPFEGENLFVESLDSSCDHLADVAQYIIDPTMCNPDTMDEEYATATQACCSGASPLEALVGSSARESSLCTLCAGGEKPDLSMEWESVPCAQYMQNAAFLTKDTDACWAMQAVGYKGCGCSEPPSDKAPNGAVQGSDEDLAGSDAHAASSPKLLLIVCWVGWLWALF